MNNLTKAEKLNIANEILASSHVSSVSAMYVGTDESGTRRYKITTNKGLVWNYYTVRVQDRTENGKEVTFADCSCKAGAAGIRCRHILRVAQMDAAKCGREMFTDVFIGYSAHRNYKAKRAVKADQTKGEEHGIVTQSCECRFNFDDKFVEYCAEHQAENAAWESEREEMHFAY